MLSGFGDGWLSRMPAAGLMMLLLMLQLPLLLLLLLLLVSDQLGVPEGDSKLGCFSSITCFFFPGPDGERVVGGGWSAALPCSGDGG